MSIPRVKPEFYFRLSGWGGVLALVGFPISVSISQAGLVLAVLGWALWNRSLRRSTDLTTMVDGIRGDDSQAALWRMPLRAPLLLKIALGVYAAQLLALIVNSLLAGGPGEIAAAFHRGLNREFKDVLLVSGAFWILAYTAHPAGERRVFRWFEIAIWVLVLSGLFSIFSRFRLSKYPYHMINGWVGSEIARYQHHLGTFFADGPAQFHIYMPIGFMNTHLTYAALLAFVFPVLLLRLLHPFLMEEQKGLTGFFKALLGLVRERKVTLFLFVSAALILILNNGRSAMLGLVGAVIVALYYFVRVYWGGRFLRLAPLAAAGVVLFAVLVNVSPRFHDRFERIMTALAGQEKHTDYHRSFLWQGTLDVIADNPVFGVGPGGWNEEIDATVLGYSQEHPRLWYAYEIIQRGHAHNDLLHLVAIAGPLCGLAFLAFIGFYLFRALGPSKSLEYEFWKWGPLVVFFGGLYQCYFQDDEVLLPFWLLVGLALRGFARAETEPADAK